MASAPTIDVANAVTTAVTASGSSHTANLPTVGLVDGDMMVVVGQIADNGKFWFADDWYTVETPNPGGGSRQILSWRVIDSSVWTPGGSQQFDYDSGTTAARSQSFTVSGADADSFLNSNNCDGALQASTDPMVLPAGALTGMGTNSLFLLAWGDESAARSITTLDADLTLIGSLNNYHHLAYEDVVSAGQNSAISTDMSSARDWDVGYWEIKAAAEGSRATLDTRVNGDGLASGVSVHTQAITLGAGTNRKLVVCAGWESTVRDVSSVTFDGTAVPAPGGNGSPATVGGDVTGRLFEYDIPDAKATGSYDVVITLDGNLSSISWACWIITDAATGALEDIQNDGARTTTSILQATLTNAATSYVGCFVINGAVGPEASFADGNVTGWFDELGTSQRAFGGDTTSKANALALWDANSSANDKVLIAFAVALAPSGGTVHTLAAAADGVATVVTEVSPRRIRSAAIDGTSTVAATMSVVRSVAAAVDGTATVTTDVSPRRIRSAQADGVATVSTEVSRQAHRSASAAGTSTVAASMSVARALEAQADGVAAVTTVITHVVAGGTEYNLAAAVDGVASVGAALNVVRALSVQADGTSTVTAVLTAGSVTALTAQVDGSSTVSAALASVRALSASSEGISTVSGSLDVIRALAASAAGSSTVTASLESGGTTELTALIGGTSTVSAGIAPLRIREARADGAATVAVEIAVLRIREAAANGFSTVAVDMAVVLGIAAAAAGVAAVEASLSHIQAVTPLVGKYGAEHARAFAKVGIAAADDYSDEHARASARIKGAGI